MSDATRFDTKNLDTKATRALADGQKTLLPARDALIARVTRQGNDMSKDALMEALTYKGLTYPKNLTKHDLVERYIKAVTTGDTIVEKLSELATAAYRDGVLADRLNGLMNEADRRDIELRKIVNEHSGYTMFRNLTWKIGTVMEAQATAHWAEQVLTDCNQGGDLREVAEYYLNQAFNVVRKQVGRALKDGIAANASNGDIFEAAAADEFISTVLRALRPETINAENMR